MEDIERRGLQPDEIIEWCMADGIAAALVDGEVMSHEEATDTEDKVRQERVENVRFALSQVVAERHQELQRELSHFTTLSKKLNKFEYADEIQSAIPGFVDPVHIPEFSIPTPNRQGYSHGVTNVVRDASRKEFRVHLESILPETSINITGRIASKLYNGSADYLKGFEDHTKGITYDGGPVDGERYNQWKEQLGAETAKMFLTLLVRVTDGYETTSTD